MNIKKIESKKDLEEVFVALNEQIYRYIFVRCGYRKELAEDITQDVFIKVWNKRDLFDQSKSSLKNWIYIVARNTLIDFQRTTKNEESINEEEQDLGINNSLENTESSLMMEVVKNGLVKLSEQDKEIITLRYIQDLDIKDISKIIGKNYIATKVMLHRAMGKLKKIVEN
ncbi:MAG: RNA polymerase sigma factor [bacterium]